MSDDSAQRWRLKELERECDRLIALGRQGRTDADNQWLQDALQELAEACGPKPYHGTAKATWPDAGEPDYENPQ